MQNKLGKKGNLFQVAFFLVALAGFFLPGTILSLVQAGEGEIEHPMIKAPAETEGCTVCGMYPYRYPTHRSQILTMDKQTLHFCSTRCLVNYLANPAQYLDSPPKGMFTWVTVYPEGIYEYAGGLFYVVGSGVHGPMGFEALPFRTRAEAGAFAAKEGGKVMRFEEITPNMLQGDHGHGMKMKR